jgi:hypothetical protein
MRVAAVFFQLAAYSGGWLGLTVGFHLPVGGWVSQLGVLGVLCVGPMVMSLLLLLLCWPMTWVRRHMLWASAVHGVFGATVWVLLWLAVAFPARPMGFVALGVLLVVALVWLLAPIVGAGAAARGRTPLVSDGWIHRFRFRAAAVLAGSEEVVSAERARPTAETPSARLAMALGVVGLAVVGVGMAVVVVAVALLFRVPSGEAAPGDSFLLDDPQMPVVLESAAGPVDVGQWTIVYDSDGKRVWDADDAVVSQTVEVHQSPFTAWMRVQSDRWDIDNESLGPEYSYHSLVADEEHTFCAEGPPGLCFVHQYEARYGDTVLIITLYLRSVPTADGFVQVIGAIERRVAAQLSS